MNEFKLSQIIVNEKTQEQIIVLKEKRGGRFLPVVIGMNEVSAIKMKISGFKPSRPLTHDLISSIIKSLGVCLERVVINDLLNGTFYAKLYLRRKDDRLTVVDARPSDCIALAVSSQVPIFVNDSVFKKIV